jgi:hypothetical protein
VEDDTPCPVADCYSYLPGQVPSLAREEFFHPLARIRLPALEDSGEYYTLRLTLSHGTRWIQFGR